MINIASCAELNILFFDKFVDVVLPEYYFISYYEFYDILKFVVVYVSATSLIKLAKSWFQLNEANAKLASLQKEKIESELHALKGQINPHFLFNSLNVLYSLVLKKSDESPEAIIKLSDILRYVIYDSNKDFVFLNDEIKLIRDYLDLQKFRVNSGSNIRFTFEVYDSNQIVAPMLLLPLVENSFKHGIKADIHQTYVDILLKSTRDEVRFEIKNNKADSDKSNVNRQGGIGLNNIKNRLNLIYPSRHSIQIFDNENFFLVILIIRNEN